MALAVGRGALTIWLALTDATPDNGCPQVVPGSTGWGQSSTATSSRWDGSASTSPPNAVAAPVAAGGAVVFSS
jgi:phytanoyl-CoA hydroxylase